MSKLALWGGVIVAAVSYQLFKQVLSGSGSVEDAVDSIYWTGFAYLTVHLFGLT